MRRPVSVLFLRVKTVAVNRTVALFVAVSLLFFGRCGRRHGTAARHRAACSGDPAAAVSALAVCAAVLLAALVGGGNANMTITSVEISAEGKASLGMTSDPRVFANQVLLTCTKPGSAIAKVTMVAGTNSGSGINGMTITKEYAIIAREFESANGGWL